MALKRILLPVLMVASTTAVLMNNGIEDDDQSLAAQSREACPSGAFSTDSVMWTHTWKQGIPPGSRVTFIKSTDTYDTHLQWLAGKTGIVSVPPGKDASYGLTGVRDYNEADVCWFEGWVDFSQSLNADPELWEGGSLKLASTCGGGKDHNGRTCGNFYKAAFKLETTPEPPTPYPTTPEPTTPYPTTPEPTTPYPTTPEPKKRSKAEKIAEAVSAIGSLCFGQEKITNKVQMIACCWNKCVKLFEDGDGECDDQAMIPCRERAEALR